MADVTGPDLGDDPDGDLEEIEAIAASPTGYGKAPRTPDPEDPPTVGHCGQQFRRYVRMGTTWEGDYEITTTTYECPTCGSEIVVTMKRDVGPPTGAGPSEESPAP